MVSYQNSDIIDHTAPQAQIVPWKNDKHKRACRWWHPCSTLIGYEVEYTIDGCIDHSLAWTISGISPNGNSWSPLLKQLQLRHRSVAARVRVCFPDNSWSDWSAVASWQRHTNQSLSQKKCIKKTQSPPPRRPLVRPSEPQKVRATSLTKKTSAQKLNLKKIIIRQLQSPKYQMPGGRQYTPSPNSILVIAAGAPWVWETEFDGENEPNTLYCAEYLSNAGFDVTVVWDKTYDCYPKGWSRGKPDLEFNDGKNHSTAADKLVLPKLEELVSQGRGPSLILAGSRGGQCTLPRLWSLGWCGATICVNAGCTVLGVVPQGCSLALITGAFDFFKQSANPQRLPQKIRRVDKSTAILVYHNPTMGHTGSPDDYQKHGHHLLIGSKLEQIIHLTISGPSSWPKAVDDSKETLWIL